MYELKETISEELYELQSVVSVVLKQKRGEDSSKSLKNYEKVPAVQKQF